MSRLIVLDRLCIPRYRFNIQPMRIQRTLGCCIATSSFLVSNAFVVPFQAGSALFHNSANPLARHTQSRTARRESESDLLFKYADPIQVEVISFGPLGASVDVVARGHNPENLIPESSQVLGQGLVLQKEIHYFRQARNNVDVVAGELLPAFVEEVRDDGRLNISLRQPGGKAKAEEVSKMIMHKLSQAPDGTLSVGDKSSPRDIGLAFPGVSKAAFKKAVAALYKLGKVEPGPDSIKLMNGKDILVKKMKSKEA